MNFSSALTGAAAAVTILGFFFAAANRYIVGKITLAVRTELQSFTEKMNQEYVTRREFEQNEEYGKEIHGRHDKEIALLWSHIGTKK